MATLTMVAVAAGTVLGKKAATTLRIATGYRRA
jgi:hypothetical protein